MQVDPIERTNWLLSAGAAAASLVVASPAFALSLAAGAAIEAANFRGLRRSAQLLLWGQVAGSRGWMALFALRFGLLVLAVGGALYVGAHPVGLVIGLSLIMPAAVIEAWRARPAVDPSAPALPPDDLDWERWNPWLARERAGGDEGDE